MEYNFKSIRNTPFKYRGQIKDQKADGFGRVKFENGDEFIGFWKAGMINGKGYYTWKNGAVYVGHWQNHSRNGKGMYFDPETGYSEIGIFKKMIY